MASSISSSHLHRDRRHPRRRLAYVAAVAIMRCRPIHDAGPATPLAPMPTCPACSPVRRCLCCRPAELCSGPSSPLSLPLHRCRLVISVYSHWGLPSLFSLSPWVSSNLPCRDVTPSAPPPPTFSAELLAAAARFVPGARCLCLIVVGALAPLCFLFSVFQNARPPATPRWLGPPLTQRSKNAGLVSSRVVCLFGLTFKSKIVHAHTRSEKRRRAYTCCGGIRCE